MFVDWLKTTKSFTAKSAQDASSRLKRVQKLINSEKIEADILEKLENNTEFKTLSMYVKSQLRRTTKLYLEYLRDK